MNNSNILKNIKINANFLLTISIVNGLTGFIMLTHIFNKNLIELFTDYGFIILILSLIEMLWIGFSLCNYVIKRNIILKDFLYILIIIPIYSISFLGQLGNSECFKCLLGPIGGELYNTYIITINICTLFLLIKKKK